jgi:Sigma-70 region 2
MNTAAHARATPLRRVTSALAVPAPGGPRSALAEFEEVYRANVDVVMAYFARRRGDPQTVADLTSDTFVRAAGAFGSFDPRRGSPRAWLFGIAAHVFAPPPRALRIAWAMAHGCHIAASVPAGATITAGPGKGWTITRKSGKATGNSGAPMGNSGPLTGNSGAPTGNSGASRRTIVVPREIRAVKGCPRPQAVKSPPPGTGNSGATGNSGPFTGNGGSAGNSGK